MTDNELSKLYAARFPQQELARKNEIWNVIVEDFLQRYVPETGTVIDAACGYGEFINNIRAQKKIAIDLNEDASRYLQSDVEFRHGESGAVLTSLENTADIVFTSNFLEHLPDKNALNNFLNCVRQALKPQGKYLILGPNLRYLPGEYWDFYDHTLGLSHFSLSEALNLSGFTVKYCVDKFLPYSTKGSLPTHPMLVRMYLKTPIIWKILGKQFFIAAEKSKPQAA